MNVLFLLLTSVSANGAPATAAPLASGPIVSTPIPGGCGSGGYGSAGCGAACDTCATECCSKPSLCERLKARFHKSKGCCEATCAPACAAPVCAPAPSCDSCCESKGPSFFEKLKGRLHKSKGCCAPACDSCGGGYAGGGCASGGCGGAGGAGCAPSAPIAPVNPGAPGLPTGPTEPSKPAEPIKQMPKDDGKGAMNTPGLPVTPTGAKVEMEVKAPFESARRHEMRVAHAADYSRLTGQLSYVHADGGIWVLRYAPLAEEDRNGGSVVLARDRMMNNYREGDLVTVEGQIISQKGSAHLGGPLYRIQAISLVDRPLK